MLLRSVRSRPTCWSFTVWSLPASTQKTSFSDAGISQKESGTNFVSLACLDQELFSILANILFRTFLCQHFLTGNDEGMCYSGVSGSPTSRPLSSPTKSKLNKIYRRDGPWDELSNCVKYVQIQYFSGGDLTVLTLSLFLWQLCVQKSHWRCFWGAFGAGPLAGHFRYEACPHRPKKLNFRMQGYPRKSQVQILSL